MFESILGYCPWGLEDADYLARLVFFCDTLWIAFCFDRVTANWLTMCTILAFVSRAETLGSIYGHGEPCSLHGFSLCERSPTQGIDLVKRLVSFTHWTKFWKRSTALARFACMYLCNSAMHGRGIRPCGACAEVNAT